MFGNPKSELVGLLLPILFVAAIAAFAAPPPKRLMVNWALGLILAGGGIMIFGLAMVLNRESVQTVLLILSAGILCSLLGSWLARGGQGSDGDDWRRRRWPKPSPPGPPGQDIDWDDFERHREDWEKQPAGRL